jgi:hypothetical protein
MIAGEINVTCPFLYITQNKEAICTNFQATLASGSGAFEYKPGEEEHSKYCKKESFADCPRYRIFDSKIA